MASIDCAMHFVVSPGCNPPARISPRNSEGRVTLPRVACWALFFVSAFTLIGTGFAAISSEPNGGRYGAGAGIGAGLGALATGLFLCSVPQGRPSAAAVAPTPESSVSNRSSSGPVAVAVVPSADPGPVSRNVDPRDPVSLSSAASVSGPVDALGDRLRVDSVSLFQVAYSQTVFKNSCNSTSSPANFSFQQ